MRKRIVSVVANLDLVAATIWEFGTRVKNLIASRGGVYPTLHLRIRLEAKQAPRLETLITNIACWAI